MARRNVPIEKCDCDIIHQDVVDRVRGRLPQEETLYDLAEFFKVFGDPTRLKILFLLEQGERGVNSICEELGMQQSTISQQLKLLRARRLVRYRKDGRNVLYRLNDEHIHAILALGIEHYQELQ